jgi:hypothetical protein
MKKLILSLYLSVAFLATTAQSTNSLPLNESGLITLSEVITVEDASQENLFTNAYNYLQSMVAKHRKLKKEPDILADSTGINLPMAYTVYNDFPVHSPHGVIKYDFTVSVKDGRYRYQATNFVFHFLKRNRYGKFVEIKGKSKALEDPFYKGNQRLWENHKIRMSEKIADLAENLRVEMMLIPNGTKEEIVKMDNDW